MKQIKTLTELCAERIISNFTLFKSNVDLLPQELQKKLQNKLNKKEFDSKYERINGKIYARCHSPIIVSSDWGNYKQ